MANGKDYTVSVLGEPGREEVSINPIGKRKWLIIPWQEMEALVEKFFPKVDPSEIDVIPGIDGSIAISNSSGGCDWESLNAWRKKNHSREGVACTRLNTWPKWRDYLRQTATMPDHEGLMVELDFEVWEKREPIIWFLIPKKKVRGQLRGTES